MGSSRGPWASFHHACFTSHVVCLSIAAASCLVSTRQSRPLSSIRLALGAMATTMDKVTVDKSYFDALLRRYVSHDKESRADNRSGLTRRLSTGQILYAYICRTGARFVCCSTTNMPSKKHTTTQILGRPDPSSCTISRVEYDSLVREDIDCALFITDLTGSYEPRKSTNCSRMLSSKAASPLKPWAC